MPFTPAHAAAVLPLRGLRLPTAALAIGSMSPDGPLFADRLPSYAVTHSLRGVLTVDVVTTLVLLALWTWVVRDVAVDLAPAAVRERLDARARPAPLTWLLAVPAAVVGAATHVLWDELTHAGRWGTDHVAWLREDHAGLSGTQWTQHTSSVLGLLVVGVVAVRWLSDRPRVPRARPPLLPWVVVPVAVVVVPLVVGTAVLLHHVATDSHRAAFLAVVTTIRVALVATAVLCAAWWALRSRAQPEYATSVRQSSSG